MAGGKLFVTDFDGTLTRRDFFHLVVEAFAPQALAEFWGGYRAGRYSHFEALAGIFASVRASEEQMLAVIGRAEPDPQLREWVGRLNAAGWEVIVASAGCEWYIRKILSASGVDVEVHANPGRFDADRGLVMSLPVGSPYFDARTGIDKSAIVRRGLESGRIVAFAGDGFPDAPAARLVPAELRFARADLAEALRSEGLEYKAFENWSEVARALCERAAMD